MAQIAIQIDSPVLTLEEFCKRSGMPDSTARMRIQEGEIPIMPKATAKERIRVNMVAYAIKCAKAANITASTDA